MTWLKQIKVRGWISFSYLFSRKKISLLHRTGLAESSISKRRKKIDEERNVKRLTLLNRGDSSLFASLDLMSKNEMSVLLLDLPVTIPILHQYFKSIR